MATTENPQQADRREQIASWLREEGYSVKDVSDAAENAAWLLAATFEGRTVFVGPRQDRPTALVVQTSAVFSARHRVQLEKLSAKRRNQFFCDLGIRMLMMGVAIQDLGEKSLEIEIFDRIYVDDLSRREFARCVRGVFAALRVIVYAFAREFDEPMPPPSTAGLTIN